jgi:endothelin-converting enzyme
VRTPSWEVEPDYLGIGADILQATHPGNLERTAALELMQKVAVLEGRFAYAASTSTDNRTQYTAATDLDRISPHLSLSYVLSAVMPPGFKYNMIGVRPPSYFANITRDILVGASDEVVQGFFMWKALKNLAPWAGSNITNQYTNWRRRMTGMPPIDFPWDKSTCLNSIERGTEWTKQITGFTATDISWMLSRFYVERSFPLEGRNVTKSLLRLVKKTFIQRMREKSWISEESKTETEKYVNKLRYNMLGYPDFLLDPPILRNMTKYLNITSKSHVWNAVANGRSDIERLWVVPGWEVDGWSSSLLEPNARYIADRLSILINAAELQFPAYMGPPDELPGWATWGYLGAVMSHELTHAYDGGPGSMVGWDQNTINEFKQRSQCLVQQYEAYSIPGVRGRPTNVNGTRTLRENMADHGGIRTAYYAWKDDSNREDKANMTVAGLESFTDDQLFFLMWAQGWCERARPELGIVNLLDPHAPKFTRILGPTANSREFREAYNCPVKEPTCEIW